jgi:hypothetical protein
VRRCTFLVGALILGMLPVIPTRAAGCTLRAGTSVTLRSSDFDPDVFVWDTEGRAIAYAARVSFPKVDEVLRHTVLAKPGTHAVIVGCNARIVRPRPAQELEDAVLVRLASGPDRGKLGWVTSSDVRV